MIWKRVGQIIKLRYCFLIYSGAAERCLFQRFYRYQCTKSLYLIVTQHFNNNKMKMNFIYHFFFILVIIAISGCNTSTKTQEDHDSHLEYSTYDNFEALVASSSSRYVETVRITSPGTEDQPMDHGFWFYNYMHKELHQFDASGRRTKLTV